MITTTKRLWAQADEERSSMGNIKMIVTVYINHKMRTDDERSYEENTKFDYIKHEILYLYFGINFF